MKTNTSAKNISTNPIALKKNIVDAILASKSKTRQPDTTPQTYSKIQDLLNQKKAEYQQEKEHKKMGENITNLRSIVDSIFHNNKPKTNRLSLVVKEKMNSIDRLKNENKELASRIIDLEKAADEGKVYRERLERDNEESRRRIDTLEKNPQRSEEEGFDKKDLKRLNSILEEKEKAIADKDETIEEGKYNLRSLEEKLTEAKNSFKK